jgi:DHA3 family macrolide efflux protein-like MFS transporter
MAEQAEPAPGNWKLPFFSIWTGQQLSWLGSALAGFALIWWVTETTGSATTLATATLVSLLPGVFLGPFVGALVDRWNRRIVMIIADSVVALSSAWLAWLFWADAMQLSHVYVTMLVRALGNTFHWPAMSASTSLMVPRDHLPRVAGLNQTIGGAVNILSPPLGALLLKVLPLHSIMAIDLVSAAFAIVPLFFIQIPQPERHAAAGDASADKPSLWADVREGLRYVWSWPGLLAVCIMALLLNFLVSPPMSLMPLLVTGHFEGDALLLGWMNSAWGVGLVVGGLILSAWGGFQRRIVTMLLGIVGLGIGLTLVGLTPAAAFPLALVGLLFGAVMNAMCNGSAFALLQGMVAPEMQGRVFTVVMSLVNAMTPLSMAAAGPVADTLGIRTLYVIAGISQIGIGVGAFFVPAIMHLEDHHKQASAEGQELSAPAPAQANVGAD